MSRVAFAWRQFTLMGAAGDGRATPAAFPLYSGNERLGQPKSGLKGVAGSPLAAPSALCSGPHAQGPGGASPGASGGRPVATGPGRSYRTGDPPGPGFVSSLGAANDTNSARPQASGTTAAEPLVYMRGIVKRFPGVTAVDGVDLALYPGEVHALLGENGAGKTTLMNVLYGLNQPDAGTVELAGATVSLHSPRAALANGIGFVAQHPLLVRRHSVLENVALAVPGGFLRPMAGLAARLNELAERYGLAVNPQAFVWQLSAGERQRVEILKALLRGARVLILDEPTSVLTPKEATELFRALTRLCERGHAVVLITHKLDEVMAAAQRITVLRAGRVAASVMAGDTDAASLARFMVGRGLEAPERRECARGETLLRLEGLNLPGHGDEPALRNVSLAVRGGEILGVAGVAGNGQQELVEVATGMLRPASGVVQVGEVNLSGARPSAFWAAGVAHVPEDRFRTGLVGNLSIAENLALRDFDRAPLARGGLVDRKALFERARRLMEEFDIRAPGPQVKARSLSGGNAQKLILARELSANPRVIVAAHPTYGLDAGATDAVQRILLERRAAGAAVLLVSEDLDEILKLSDRVAVLHEGQVMGVLDAADATPERLGLLMAGRREAAVAEA